MSSIGVIGGVGIRGTVTESRPAPGEKIDGEMLMSVSISTSLIISVKGVFGARRMGVGVRGSSMVRRNARFDTLEESNKLSKFVFYNVLFYSFSLPLGGKMVSVKRSAGTHHGMRCFVDMIAPSRS